MFPNAVGLLGCGRMGGALARGWLSAHSERTGGWLHIVDPGLSEATRVELSDLGGAVGTKFPSGLDVLVLAIKPQLFGENVGLIRKAIDGKTLVLSIMAGISLDRLGTALGTRNVIRAMPNTPGAIGRGVTTWIADETVPREQRSVAHLLLSAIGASVTLPDEASLEAATAVAGCGPAYVFLLAEAMAAAGVAEGLDPAVAAKLAYETVSGAGAMLQLRAEEGAAQLRHEVTSPKGVTAAALEVLMRPSGIPDLMTEAVRAAIQRSMELGRES
jgi:pyrroline-5-carboxylate reductase